VSMTEVKGTMPQADPHYSPKGAHPEEEDEHDPLPIIDETPMPSTGGLVPEGAE
jgi:hypothetical protein